MKRKQKNNIKVRFGQSVCKYRHALGLSQEELSFRSELHRTYIGDIERGSRNISLESIQKLSKGLGIRISELMEGVDTDDSP